MPRPQVIDSVHVAKEVFSQAPKTGVQVSVLDICTFDVAFQQMRDLAPMQVSVLDICTFDVAFQQMRDLAPAAHLQ